MVDWDALKEIEEKIRNCTKCPLHKTRTNPVPGEGGFEKGILIVGEAPGKNEDLQGRPFVGRAGKLLDDLLSSIGLSRKDVFITNVLKCRPPNNRDPTEEEISACSPYLEAQINALQPKLIVTLGRFAWAWMCEHFGIRYRKLTEAHGKLYTSSTLFGSYRIFPTFHPAAALRRKEILDLLREDFETLKAVLETL